MKVVFLTNVPSPYRIDFFNELTRYMDVTVIFERESATNRDENWKSDDLYRFNAVFLKGLKFGTDASVSTNVIKSIKKEKADLIVICGYSTPTAMIAIEYLYLHNIKFILSVDGGIIHKNESIILKKIKHHLVKSASYYLSTGKQTNHYLEYYGAEAKDIFIYPFSSVNSKYVLQKPLSCSEKYTIRQEKEIHGEFILLTVGQFIKRKGFDLLLRTISNLPDEIICYIVGGEATDEYLRIIKETRIDSRVVFLPFSSKDSLMYIYQSADVFVLPTREDIWGLVINEAQANGLPVITTDKCVAGTEMVINFENGLIIPADDTEALNKAIMYMYDNKDSLYSMSANAVKTARNYTIENMAFVHKKIFNELIKNED